MILRGQIGKKIFLIRNFKKRCKRVYSGISLEQHPFWLKFSHERGEETLEAEDDPG